MQIQSILFILVIGAVTVLAKKGSSEEDRNVQAIPVSPNVDSQPMFVVSGPVGKRKPNRSPQGRPFQYQQQMDGRYPQASFYSQRPGMQQTSFGGQPPFGQNSFSTYPGSQQSPNSFSASMGSPRPFYAGRPNQFNGNGRPNQFSGNGRPNQYPGNGRPNQFPGNGEFSANSQFPGNSQFSANSQFPGNNPFPGNSQFSANSQFPGSSPFPGNTQFSSSSQFPGSSQPSFSAQFPGSTFPMTS